MNGHDPFSLFAATLSDKLLQPGSKRGYFWICNQCQLISTLTECFPKYYSQNNACIATQGLVRTALECHPGSTIEESFHINAHQSSWNQAKSSQSRISSTYIRIRQENLAEVPFECHFFQRCTRVSDGNKMITGFDSHRMMSAIPKIIKHGVDFSCP